SLFLPRVLLFAKLASHVCTSWLRSGGGPRGHESSRFDSTPSRSCSRDPLFACRRIGACSGRGPSQDCPVGTLAALLRETREIGSPMFHLNEVRLPPRVGQCAIPQLVQTWPSGQ